MPVVALALAATSEAAAPTPVVPVNEQHRIAAQFGSLAYVPTWVPRGYLFIRSKATPPRGPRTGSILWGNLQIDFARAGAALLWNVIWPTQAPDCRYPPTGPFAPTLARAERDFRPWRGTVRGRTITYVPGNHTRSAHACIPSSDGRFEITASATGLTATPLVRVVASARLVR
jgi:hypothetical protein